MKHKLFYIILSVVVLILIILGFILSSRGFFTNPNCGKDKYNFDITINSKTDFIDFLKVNNEKINWVRLDDFKNITGRMNYKDIKNAEIDWDKVAIQVQIEKSWFKTTYVLHYRPFTCSEFTLKMSDDGRVIVSGCCGI